ncbi:hypothetical protein SLEP1_g14608 [Rubroshorea leprosula]|uniref:Uncharacterized protein n=1 Tax=Rubroshorea leprosula TaxID=152421 RepID=A0AAV5IJL8_9ROSI|nr:hypothetical protein SLEP1_g14608 [Rubroshorea leprosula]
MCVNNKPRATTITRGSKSLSSTTPDEKADAEGAIQPLYQPCCGRSAPVLETMANQPLYFMLSAEHPF